MKTNYWEKKITKFCNKKIGINLHHLILKRIVEANKLFWRKKNPIGRHFRELFWTKKLQIIRGNENRVNQDICPSLKLFLLSIPTLSGACMVIFKQRSCFYNSHSPHVSISVIRCQFSARLYKSCSVSQRKLYDSCAYVAKC